MDYTKIYHSIINHRIQNPLPNIEYGEFHHIIPRSLGGSDDKSNLVRLSAREHFICHALLAEMWNTTPISIRIDHYCNDRNIYYYSIIGNAAVSKTVVKMAYLGSNPNSSAKKADIV